MFFVGYGKGTGTAWFDDLALEEVAAEDIQLQVTRGYPVPWRDQSFQYGQFIEYLCGLTPSMFSEKLFDGSFEGVPPYGLLFARKPTAWNSPGIRTGPCIAALYTFDTESARSTASESQRIAMKPGDPATLGISQSGLSVKRGRTAARCHCSSERRISRRRFAWQFGARARPMRKPTFHPARSGSDSLHDRSHRNRYHATLTISFRGPGEMWIDQISFMPKDNVFGWRRDVANALKALRPGIIRFGGSTTEGFEWTDTIGDPTRRVPFTTYWGGLEPGNAGLEEFVQLCQWVGAEPLICIRFTGKTPQDAADQVEYFNGPRRLAHGKPPRGERSPASLMA